MTIRRIAVGVDGSEGSARAAAWAGGLAAALGAEVVAIHALEMTAYPVSVEAASAATAAVPPEAFDQWRAGVRAQLEGPWSEPLRAAGVRLRTVLVDGRAPIVIMAMAEAEDVDLVVLGSRGRGGFTELLLGSVSHQLTHQARLPVIVVPPGRR